MLGTVAAALVAGRQEKKQSRPVSCRVAGHELERARGVCESCNVTLVGP